MPDIGQALAIIPVRGGQEVKTQQTGLEIGCSTFESAHSVIDIIMPVSQSYRRDNTEDSLVRRSNAGGTLQSV